MSKETKYQYWTLIEKVGESFKDKIKIGEYISAPFKKEEWEILDRKEAKIKFMCSGKYICRTLKDIPDKEKLKILKSKLKGEQK